jgi:hypothetical protein
MSLAWWWGLHRSYGRPTRKGRDEASTTVSTKWAVRMLWQYVVARRSVPTVDASKSFARSQRFQSAVQPITRFVGSWQEKEHLHITQQQVQLFKIIRQFRLIITADPRKRRDGLTRKPIDGGRSVYPSLPLLQLN